MSRLFCFTLELELADETTQEQAEKLLSVLEDTCHHCLILDSVFDTSVEEVS
jgi:hypothetical protein